MMDPDLLRLAEERVKIMTERARLLKYAGPNHPHRAQENKKRVKHRKKMRARLKDNDMAICARVMEIYNQERELP